MVREQGPLKLDNPLPRIAWGTIGAVSIVAFLFGFFVLGRFQQDGPTLGAWAAFCRAVGLTADSRAAGEPQPPVLTPTRIAWTGNTLARIASGNQEHGAFVALNCVVCHGEGGVSPSTLVPTLAGMNSAVDSADVAAYFARRPNGLTSAVAGEDAPEGSRSLRQHDPAIRLVFAGDPGRGIPPCAACHGPGALKLGAPALRGQHAEYVERQLGAFAQGMRRNDINEQMRVIAQELKADEIHAVAGYYGAAVEHE